MKKYYFALFCALMAVTSAMAAPQSGDRIVAAQVHAVEWNDATFRPTMDVTSFDLGLNAQLIPSEDESVLILSGLCDLFNIPVHVDDATRKAWIETGMPLDTYTDQYNRDVVRTIYALPEQCLADAEADMNANLYGSILEDGSIAFDGGIVFLVSESTDVQDLATAGDANETVWMSSPLFRDMRLFVPNAIHQFRVDNETDKYASKQIPRFDELTRATVTVTVRNGLFAIIHGGFRPSKPNGPPPVCGPGSGNNDSADTSDGNSTLNKGRLFPDGLGGHKPFKAQRPENCKLGPEVGTIGSEDASSIKAADGQDTFNAMKPNVTYVINGGFKPKKKEDPSACGVIGDFELKVANTHTPGGQIEALRPFNGNNGLVLVRDSAGVRPPIPPVVRPCGLVDNDNNEVAHTRTPGGQVASAPNHENDNIEAGYKPHKNDPPRPCSDPWIWIMKLESFNNQLPNRFNPNPSVASSKPADEQFSVPVYVFQNPEDKTITVYNLYGEGGVTTCTIVPEERKMSIADVTELIDHLLTAGNDGANQVIDDVNGDGKINIDDATTLIDMLLQSAE